LARSSSLCHEKEAAKETGGAQEAAEEKSIHKARG
jgi:hypothetical protein